MFIPSYKEGFFMDIIDISKQIEAEKRKKISKENTIPKEFSWQPVEATVYTVPPFVIPDIRSKKCTKEALSKVLAFIDMVKQKRYAHGCTVMPIPTTSRQLISICGS